jgi:hypothetical protein
MAQGPVNRPKDGIAALSGVIETDWAPYGFTMNWMFTRPGVAVRFEKDEPYCHIFPVQCSALESIEPELRLLSENPELKRQHEIWTTSRSRFNADSLAPRRRRRNGRSSIIAASIPRGIPRSRKLIARGYG